MDGQVQIPGWRIVTGSVQGAIHKNLGMPNQDAIRFFQKVPEKLPVILSLADGLGDPAFFRSDRGSRFAVEAAVEVALQFLDCADPQGELSEEIIRKQFCRKFASLWKERVIRDFRNDPPEDCRLVSNEKKANTYNRHIIFADETQRSEAIAVYPYSTTSITLIATLQFIIVIQIGNGDVLMVEPTGEISRPFPAALQDIGVHSLSMPESWNLFKIWHRDCVACSLPVAVFVTTDGYSDSYDYRQDFEKYCVSGFHDFFIEYDAEAIQDGIQSILDRISNEGCGDDTTLGILCCPDQFRSTPLIFPKVPLPEEEQPVSSAPANGDYEAVAQPAEEGSGKPQDPVAPVVEGQEGDPATGLESMPAGDPVQIAGIAGLPDTCLDPGDPLFEDQGPDKNEDKGNSEKVQ